MKKRISGIVLAFACCLGFGLLNVDAREYSDYLVNPHMNQVAPPTYGVEAALGTTADSCYAVNAAVIFTGFKTLPTSFGATDASVHMTLYENDQAPNEDEIIKRYQAVYADSECYKVIVGDIFTTGVLDSTGDQTCELIMDFVMSGHYYGPRIESTILTYRMFMD